MSSSLAMNTLLEQQLRREAAVEVTAIMQKSTLFSLNIGKEVARFDIEECIQGPELGRGTFSVVYEVEDIHLSPPVLVSKSKDNTTPTRPLRRRSCQELDSKGGPATSAGAFRSLWEKQKSRDTRRRKSTTDLTFDMMVDIRDRKFISQTTMRDGMARYAIKKLSMETQQKASSRNANDRELFMTGVVDLAMEVEFLSILQHPHIIKMRGISVLPPCSDSSFILMDRLYETLAEKLQNWKKDYSKLNILKSKRCRRHFFARRMCIAQDIASALNYLHSNSIIHRDLKPANMGFDARGDIKLFDFGLAREMTNEDLSDNGYYHLTKETGSLRYMSPEVGRGLPYNHKADVYSYSLIVWGIFKLDIPFRKFDSLSKEVFMQKVHYGGVRPPFEKSWPSILIETIQDCWSPNISDRPECSDIMYNLRKEISGFCITNGKDDMLDELDNSNKTHDSALAKLAKVL